jgi:hypothetical protein
MDQVAEAASGRWGRHLEALSLSGWELDRLVHEPDRLESLGVGNDETGIVAFSAGLAVEEICWLGGGALSLRSGASSSSSPARGSGSSRRGAETADAPIWPGAVTHQPPK